MITIAHRGFSAAAPENTLAAFSRAIQAGSDLVEMDLRLSRDAQVIVFHDRELDRTTDGEGPAGERTLAQLKELDAGSWFSPEFAGEKIPTLDEVLELFAPTRTGLYLELKIDRGEENVREELVPRVLNVLAGRAVPERLFLASFDHPALRLVRSLGPGLPTGLIFGEKEIWDLLPTGN